MKTSESVKFYGTGTSDLYYKIYDVVFTLSYRSKEVTVESIHRHLLSSARRRKYDVVNFIILATGGACDRNVVIVSRLLHNFASKNRPGISSK